MSMRTSQIITSSRTSAITIANDDDGNTLRNLFSPNSSVGTQSETSTAQRNTPPSAEPRFIMPQTNSEIQDDRTAQNDVPLNSSTSNSPPTHDIGGGGGASANLEAASSTNLNENRQQTSTYRATTENNNTVTHTDNNDDQEPHHQTYLYNPGATHSAPAEQTTSLSTVAHQDDAQTPNNPPASASMNNPSEFAMRTFGYAVFTLGSAVTIYNLIMKSNELEIADTLDAHTSSTQMLASAIPGVVISGAIEVTGQVISYFCSSRSNNSATDHATGDDLNSNHEQPHAVGTVTIPPNEQTPLIGHDYQSETLDNNIDISHRQG